MVGNVTEVWYPFATGVLNGGLPYINHWDNKPPIFHFLNIIIAGTGHYMLTFYILIGIANGTTAVLLWKWSRDAGYERIGVVAGITYTGLLPLYVGTVINPRPFAMVAILCALLVSSPLSKGILIAIAGLFSQFSILAIPGLLLHKYLDSSWSCETPKNFIWIIKFCIAGLATVIATYGLVGIIWNPETAIRGFEYNWLSTGEYVSGYTQRELTAWSDPISWGTAQITRARSMIPALIFSMATVIHWKRNRPWVSLVPTSIICATFLIFPIVIRPTSIYWLPALPFISILASFGIWTILEE